MMKVHKAEQQFLILPKDCTLRLRGQSYFISFLLVLNRKWLYSIANFTMVLTSKYRGLQEVAFVQLAVKFWNFPATQNLRSIVYCPLDKAYYLLPVLLTY